MIINLLYYIGIIILTGLLFGKVAKYFKLPNVTGYILGGLIISPSIMGHLGVNIVPNNIAEILTPISEIALGFIAFTIGTEFQLSYFKKVGMKPIVIAFFESFFAVVFIFVVLLLFKVEIGFAIVLASIGAATAPAATLMVIKQYKAKGKVTETLMSVVAIDDATAMIFFGIAIAISKALGSASTNITWTIFKPIIEVVVSLGIGFVVGLIITLLLKWFTGRSNRVSVVTAFLLITVSISSIFTYFRVPFDFSSLLSCMMAGAVLTNLSSERKTSSILELIDRFTPPIMISFFVLSGINLELSVLKTVGIIGIIYIVMRVVGKWTGAWLGGKITKASPEVQKYLGFSLIPQAGVAIGLSLVARSVLEPIQAAQLTAVILSATLIYELIGPLITKISLQKAGEIIVEKK
ncbi:MAG: cation:proton antiporter [Bacilli bacterium]|nr:cation:proton antiporter [Bacilli bacterium]MDD3121747.1 cation:proton antiporter [Bacilli bacterium]MDD4482539.1 cation:proton antiporter [Bacilli bacterium]MDD5183381.1 cation:proton antiporter [Bacilli bacterium]